MTRRFPVGSSQRSRIPFQSCDTRGSSRSDRQSLLTGGTCLCALRQRELFNATAGRKAPVPAGVSGSGQSLCRNSHLLICVFLAHRYVTVIRWLQETKVFGTTHKQKARSVIALGTLGRKVLELLLRAMLHVCLCSKPAIVSRQNRSIDVAGVIGGQKGNNRCDLFWPGRPSRRALHNCHHLRQSCLVGYATPHPNPRFDTARTNRIATNATLTVMKGNTPG